MAENAATPGSDPVDPYAAAKSTQRDTLKWLTTTFAGVIGVVIAGTSLTGITKLPARDQSIAILGCGLGLLALVAATGIMLELLLPRAFYFGELLDRKNKKLLRRLNAHVVEFLPPEFASIEEFVKQRDGAVEKIRANRDKPYSETYLAGAAFLDDYFDAIARLGYLAHYELLRSRLRNRQWVLFGLAFLAIAGLGLFAVKVGSVKEPPPTKAPPVEARVTLDLSPIASKPQPSTSHTSLLRQLLDTALNSGVITAGSASSSKCLLGPVLELIQSLGDAGALSKDTAIELRDELVKNSVEAGKEIVIEVAKSIIARSVPAEPYLPLTLSIGSACGSCCTAPPAHATPAASTKCKAMTVRAQ